MSGLDVRPARKHLIFLAAGMFVTGCDNYIVAGLLPGLGATLGASAAAVGQGVTAFDLTYVVSAPLFAVLLAGRPARAVLLAALTVFGLGNLLTLAAGGLPEYLLGRGIAGLGAGILSPIVVAVTTAVSDPGSRGRVLSIIWGANSAGAVAGVPFGLWLAGLFGWQAAIWLILLLTAIAALGIATRLPVVPVVAPPSLRERMLIMTDRRVLAVLGVTLITTTAGLGLYTYAAPVTLESGAAHSVPAVLWAWSIGGLAGSTSIGYLADRTGRPRAVLAGVLALLGTAFLLLPVLGQIPVLGLLPYALWGFAGWAIVTPIQTILIGIRPDQPATVAALCGSAVGLGGAMGSTLGGLALAAGLSAPSLPFAAAGVVVIALFWQLSLAARSRES
ncbi:MAG: MFS transporter [Kutzneria sp.]|nr:MFS transporter [Kutzneria sp.]